MSKGLQHPDFHHSILISLLRGLAAIQVAAAHLRAQLFPGLSTLHDPTLWYQVLAFFTGFAHQAVLVFFLLSGWLVGGSLLNRLHEPHALGAYAIDRLTRLWIVLVPAFLLTLGVGTLTAAVDPTALSFSYHNEYSVASFLGNLVGLQDMAVPRFGGNFPLWSLANEIWYYVLFPLIVLPFLGRTALRRAAALLAFVLALWFLSDAILLYLPVWLLGVAFSRIRIDTERWQRGLLVAVVAALSVYFRLAGYTDKLGPSSYTQDVVLAFAFLLLLSSLQFRADPAHSLVRTASKAGERCAAFSFTLYVVHIPLLVLLRHWYRPLFHAGLAPDRLGSLATYATLLVLIVFLAYLFHLPFEAQTARMRTLIKRLLFQRHSGWPNSTPAPAPSADRP